MMNDDDSDDSDDAGDDDHQPQPHQEPHAACQITAAYAIELHWFQASPGESCRNMSLFVGCFRKLKRHISTSWAAPSLPL